MTKIAPSFLAADFLNLGESSRLINATSADYFHMDVMDGVFVPNISFGFPVVKAVAQMAQKPLDVHLMIVNPENYALKFAEIQGVEMVSFHVNATRDPRKLLQDLHAKGVKAGLVINPDIPVDALYPYLEDCDFVLIMSVFAGFGGQSFIPETYSRIERIAAEIAERGLDVDIEVDGGVGPANASLLAEKGASILVAGTSVFKADDPAATILAMK